MTLATRCSACGTSFRVVQDQLKVSGGWVRCGRCGEVFNAIEGLYEVGSPMAEVETDRRPPAVPLQEPPATPAASVPVETPEAPTAPPAIERTPVPSLADRPAPAAEPAQPEPVDAPATAKAVELPPRTADAGGASDATGRQPARPASAELAPERPRAPAQDAAEAIEDYELLVPSPADEWRPADRPASEATPSFVRSAERAARWRAPSTRRALSAAAVLLLGLLGLQAAVAYRDIVAVRWPWARTPLMQVCAVLACRVEPLRFIAALSVESSGLQQLGAAPIYGLSVVLRNRSDIDLMAPALDLVLTDTQGGVVARRVLTMADLGRPSSVIAAGSEMSGQTSLDVGGRRVSGYTIEIFYP